MNYLKFLEFKDKLPQGDTAQFQTLVKEDRPFAVCNRILAEDAAGTTIVI